ncbi:Papain family cysteine protease containing protein, partial [Reticulomyxa filosa]
MSKFALAFVAVIGCVLSKERYSYKGESWKKELDLNDLVKMDMPQAWDDWMAYFKKTYKSTEEETYRFGIFEQNVKKIAEWNTNKKNKARLRPNRFADMTKEEFSEYVNPKKSKVSRKDAQYTIGKQRKAPSNAAATTTTTTTTDPISVDWSAQGYVSP